MEKKEVSELNVSVLKEIASETSKVFLGNRTRNAKIFEDNYGQGAFKYKDYFIYGVVPNIISYSSSSKVLESLQKELFNLDFKLLKYHFGEEKEFIRNLGRVDLMNSPETLDSRVFFPNMRLQINNCLKTSALEKELKKRYFKIEKKEFNNETYKPTIVEIFFFPSTKYAHLALGTNLKKDRITKYSNSMKNILNLKQ